MFFLIFSLLVSPDDPALGKIVGGHFQSHLISGKDPDIVHAELSADGG